MPLVVRMSHDVYFAISIKKKSSLPRKINARTQNSWTNINIDLISYFLPHISSKFYYSPVVPNYMNNKEIFFSLGQCLGRLRFHHQFDSFARLCFASNEPLQSKSLCRVQHILHNWVTLLDADSVCWIPTSKNFRAYGIRR